MFLDTSCINIYAANKFNVPSKNERSEGLRARLRLTRIPNTVVFIAVTRLLCERNEINVMHIVLRRVSFRSAHDKFLY